MRPVGEIDRRLGVGRVLALLAVLALAGSYLYVLYRIVEVGGATRPFLLVIGATLLAATASARLIPHRVAVALGVVGLVVGLVWYVTHLPQVPPLQLLAADVVAYLTGKSILQILNVDLWALGFAPAPLFLSWYGALRRQYVTAVVAAGGALGFLVLTGDAGAMTTALGVVAAAATLGLGEADRAGGSLLAVERVTLVLAVMVLALSVNVVPGGAGATSSTLSPLDGTSDASEAENLEGSLLATDDRLRLQGSIDLSSEERFEVRSSRPAYWRVGAYDRYTGNGWVRVGEARPYDAGDSLDDPPQAGERIRQRYELLSSMRILPAAWRPQSVEGGVADEVKVTALGALTPTESLDAGTTYSVRSVRPVTSPQVLRNAGDDYPERIERRYLQLPSSTPDRVGRLTDNVTEGADSAYEKAERIEAYLERTKSYSLDVQRPDDDVVDGFLFEMDAGYCTYFATSMAVMLREEGVPARVAVGYTTGERVDANEWLVRGLQSHMWVEVYFPDVGWVRFDPTPAGPRQRAEAEELPGIDPPTTTSTTPNTTRPPENRTTMTTRERPTPTVPEPDDVSRPRDLLDPEDGMRLGLGLLVVVGLSTGARRLGLTAAVRRAVAVRWQRPTGSPDDDAARAYRRLEWLLADRHRERAPGEPVRSYLRALDADRRAWRVAEIRERAVYGDGVTREQADEAMALVDELVDDAGS